MDRESKISSPPSKKTVLQDKPGKSGIVKRFLNWIAKGVEKPEMGGNSCPT
ncbi:MAG: hypothetical protein JRJ27_01665 [Deltaproteobacteria bacterium]|nr:hypothetical protein [Deltaproteobacteria bacterium]